MELHDEQLQIATVKDIEKAVDLVNEFIRTKKARPIVENT
jgi:predicted CoA-binding protein